MSLKRESLFVYMNDYMIGTLTQYAKRGYAFQYDVSWLSESEARPISLSLPLRKEAYFGDVVYNFFDNLLPDNLQIRERIQKMFHTNSLEPFELLTNIGRECVGAIQLTTKEQPVNKTVQAEKVSHEEIEKILMHIKNAPLGMLSRDQDFRISIAGAQEKTGFLWYQNSWHRPLNMTPTTHIFKLPIGRIEHQEIDLTDSCENEWICTEIAKAFGFDVAPAEIAKFGSQKVLIVERFDRKWSHDKKWLMRLPQEDLCQALAISPHLKYESDGGPGMQEIMNLLLRSDQPMLDREKFFKSQILFYLLAAIDGHAKNFSIFLRPANAISLTPLYDIMSAFPLIRKNQLEKKKIKMAMSVVGKNWHYRWYEIHRRHFISTAKAIKFSMKQAEQLVDEMMDQIESVIELVSVKIPRNFPDYIADAIFQGIREAKDHC